MIRHLDGADCDGDAVAVGAELQVGGAGAKLVGGGVDEEAGGVRGVVDDGEGLAGVEHVARRLDLARHLRGAALHVCKYMYARMYACIVYTLNVNA